MTYKLKLNPDNSITVLGLKQKPSGQVLNLPLSNFILMKHPLLLQGKIVSLSHSKLRSVMLEWLES